MSNFFSWSDAFSVHNKKMDSEHKQLINYVNGFYTAAEGGVHSDCMNAFNEIVKFTTYHFKDEEQLMEAANYPLFSRHKMIHQQLISQVTELGKKLAASKPGVTDEIKVFLKTWLTAHIKGIDMQYSEYLNDEPGHQLKTKRA
jgi:hemerythrin